MADALIIVNPRSANGNTGRRWQATEAVLRDRLPPFDVAFTERANHATEIAREGVERYRRIILLGGDGTLNEVVNGLVEDDRLVNPEVELGVIASGTGGDFIRTLGLPRDVAGAAERLAEGKTRAIDLAKVRYRREDGEEAVRYYINEAEIGMGAAVCRAVNRASKRWGGRISFTRAILVTMLRYPNQQVRLAVDRAPAEAVTINNVWLANGVYSGGGIRCAPRARPDDGLLDIVQVGAMSTWEKITGLPKLRSGDFSGNPNILYRTARHVEAESDSPVPVEVEGEPIGYLPAAFDVLDERLSVLT